MDPTKEKLILTLNCGSSSLKFGVYRAAPKDPRLVCEGEAEEIGRANSSLWFKRGSEKNNVPPAYKDHAGALEQALALLRQQGIERFSCAGHRLVHGGKEVQEHLELTPAVLDQLRAAVPFAPLHLPASIAVLEAMQKKMPELRQIVCFDTAFHTTMPDVARCLALPEDVRKLGVQRYGFHGLSLESILAQLDPVPARLVVAHLGNGSSITAIRDGKSVDTSMGLTPTGGVMMGTRTGDLDPGVLIFLARHGFANRADLETLVDKKSGLLGVSGLSSDVRQLVEARARNAQADLALRMFCYQVRKTIAAMAAALGGLDLLVFTGGIGEHALELRHEICEGLKWIDAFQIRVLPSQEDLQIARITMQNT